MTTRDDFFVGYLPTPALVARRVGAVATLVLVTLSAAAAVLAARQADPGDAVWSDATTELTGWIALEPAPTVETAEGTALVVGFNKRGARERLASVTFATLRGTVLSRDGVRMLELLPGDEAIQPAPTGGIPAPPATRWRAVGVETLTGEITDPKCFLGAMKPGRGMTHRSCAAVCIAGGIPPVLVVEARPDSARPARALVLVAPDGAPIAGDDLARLLTFVGEHAVTVRGEVWRSDNAPFDAMRIDASTIARR